MSNGVPVYLPDRTIIGRAIASADGKHIELDLYSDTPIAELMNEQLVGISIMYLDADRAVDVINNKEKTDGTTQ